MAQQSELEALMKKMQREGTQQDKERNVLKSLVNEKDYQISELRDSIKEAKETLRLIQESSELQEQRISDCFKMIKRLKGKD